METFRKKDVVGAVNYIYRAKTGRDGISYSNCYDYNLNQIENPLEYGKELRDQILRLRRDVPYWKAAISPEFGFMVDDLLPRAVYAFRAYMKRLGHDAILLAVEHNDTPIRHVHLLVPEVYRGWDLHRHKTFISYHIPQYRFTKTLPIRLGVNLINVIGRRPNLPTLNHLAHDLRWTPIDDRIRYRLGKGRVVNMSHRLRKFKNIYDQIEHVEEVTRLRALVRAGLAVSPDKKVLFYLLPEYYRLLFSLNRSYEGEFVFSNLRSIWLTLDDLKSRGYRIDTRLHPHPEQNTTATISRGVIPPFLTPERPILTSS
jgi:hypothetical protein